MKRGPRIEVPSAREDELPMRSLIATSFACLAGGLLLAYVATGRESAQAGVSEAHDAVPSAAAGAEEPPAPPPPQPSAPPEPAPEPAPEAAVEPDAGPPPSAEPAIAASVEPDAVPAPAPPVATPPPATPPATKERVLRVEPGVFAYLRCEGLPKRRGQFPCPRDRTLETRLREIIEALPACREAHAISRGGYDIRLELGAGGAVEELHVKAPNEAADRAVRACAGPTLRKERTALRPTRMIVSVRFKAR